MTAAAAAAARAASASAPRRYRTTIRAGSLRLPARIDSLAPTLRVQVARTVDPRVVAIVVRRDNEIVCRTTGGDCPDRGLRGHRAYTYTATAEDRWAESTPAIFGPFRLPNSAPEVALRGSRRVRHGVRVRYVARAVDRDGDVLRYAWAVDGHRVQTVTRRVSVVFGRGRHTVAVTVRDRYRGVRLRWMVVLVV